MTEEAKTHLRQLNKGKAPSDATRAKISAAGKGRVHSAETRAKISAVHKGRPKSPEHVAKMRAQATGKVPSAETKAKLSASTKGRPRPPEVREAIRQGRLRARATPESREAARRIWITNGVEDTRIHPSEAIPLGWEKGRRTKGYVAHNKGKSLSDQTRERLSKALKGKTAWNKGKVSDAMKAQRSPHGPH
jgi:hypothetical protein